MPRNETKAKRDVGKRNSSTKSIHQRPRSRFFALLFVVVVVSNLLRPLTPRRITHRNDPPRNGETERERERDFDKVCSGDKTSTLDVYLRFKLSAGRPPPISRNPCVTPDSFFLEGVRVYLAFSAHLFLSFPFFLFLLLFIADDSTKSRGARARVESRRLDAGTRSSYFQLRGTTLVLVPPLFIMNGGLLLLLLLLPPSAFLSANSQKA